MSGLGRLPVQLLETFVCSFSANMRLYFSWVSTQGGVGGLPQKRPHCVQSSP